jgi:glycosyltransferase involved in cell wall biosynthesis
VFLRAALSVHARRPQAAFVLVGDGPMLAQLQTFIERFGLTRAVHLAGARDDMAAVFNEIDIAVSSSHSEAMPLAVMEAMASGLPVVACKVGGIPDLVEHGVTGWLANESDYEGLATQIVELIDDEALRAAAGAAGRARAVARFALERSVEATMRLLGELSAQRGDTRRFAALHEARPIRANGAAVKATAQR